VEDNKEDEDTIYIKRSEFRPDDPIWKGYIETSPPATPYQTWYTSSTTEPSVSFTGAALTY